MSRWSLYTWKRDGRSLRRAVPALAVLAAMLTMSAGVAAGAAGAVERDVLGSGGLTQIELSSFEGDASVRSLTASALRDAGSVPGVRQVVGDYSSVLYAEEAGTYDLTSHTLTPGDNLPVSAGAIPAVLDRRRSFCPPTRKGPTSRRSSGRPSPSATPRLPGPRPGPPASFS
ncbi:hypothetical protein [Streptomyces sp. TRM72054]|uniref:hypothetical protein n=1 Tax=Streptomyces sp. TRM72054 TaxID=2870562 RepID=UPI0021AB8B68|nr:hypothetical protein [Streptomyces sp. TRM72054]